MKLATRLIVFSILSMTALPASEFGLAPGDFFPEISLPSFEGREAEKSMKRRTIAAFRGKKVLLNIFASW